MNGDLEKEKNSFSFKKFLFNDEKTKTENVEPGKKIENPVVVSQPQVMYVNNGINTVGVINQETYTKLKSVLSRCNLPGPDYLELKTSSDAMRDILPDENQRLLVSFASLKATSTSLTKEIVLNSIVKYIEFIENERKTSEIEFKEIYDSEITDRQLIIDEKIMKVEDSKKKITELQESIVLLSNEINTLSGEMVSKQTELEIKKKNFDVTVDTIVNELKNDSIKIETLIK